MATLIDIFEPRKKYLLGIVSNGKVKETAIRVDAVSRNVVYYCHLNSFNVDAEKAAQTLADEFNLEVTEASARITRPSPASNELDHIGAIEGIPAHTSLADVVSAIQYWYAAPEGWAVRDDSNTWIQNDRQKYEIVVPKPTH